MKKRILALLIAVSLVAGMIPATAATRAELRGVTSNGLCYTAYSDHIEIIGCVYNTTELVIPDTIEGLPVTIIADSAFNSQGNLLSVVIGNSVTTLGDNAFNFCYNLTSVVIGSSVTSIGDSAFSLCERLTSVVIPDSVTFIADGAFSCCYSLSTVVISNSITAIGDYVFESCHSLTNVVIPNSVTTIGAGAFFDCDSLTRMEIPDSVTMIGENAFGDCSNLTSVVIPDSVTMIGENAFSSCPSLSGIYVDQNNPNYSSDDRGVLFDKQKTLLIRTPFAITGSYTIPDSVTTIGESAFLYCDRLTDVVIGDSVTTIGGHAFSECDSLTSVVIGDSVTTISNAAFYDCDSLTSVVIGDSVTTIGGHAFNYCDSLASVVIGCSVTTIGSYAFSNGGSLNEIRFKGDAPSFGDSAFYQITTAVYYPNNNPTWTTDVMQDYGGTITWLPYTDDTEDEPEKPCLLSLLLEEDFLAFAALAYREMDQSDYKKTVREVLGESWDADWKDSGMTWSQLCGRIAAWKLEKVWEPSDGFFAAVFVNDNGEAVLAYRGSENPANIPSDPDAWDDWMRNDFPMELGNEVGTQFPYMLMVCDEVAAMFGTENFITTGHSLGGAWADSASAYSGCRAVTFNSISVLDALYFHSPQFLGAEFRGVDQWNIQAHINQYDVLAGAYEHTTTDLLKPYVAHASKNSAAAVGANHGMESIISLNSKGEPALTEVTNTFSPDKAITHNLNSDLVSALIKANVPLYGIRDTILDLGTSGKNTFSAGLGFAAGRTSYGGSGSDTINSGIRSDVLVGGPGTDYLDGGFGDDAYAYFKGDGLDYIHDISGDDALWLYGFSDDDNLDVYEGLEDDYIWIRCNGEAIAAISKKNRAYSAEFLNTKSFKVFVDHRDREPDETDITAYFSKFLSGSHLIISCPVHVEVLDPSGNVVHTLTDGEVGSWYTDYGSFYVFEEENGEYGKVLDLAVGCTARIVGAGEGTMDVTYQIPVDGELTDPVSVSGVPVTENLTATIEEKADGEVYLVIDEDSDGEADSERKLSGECPFTDVPEGSFYYEPVLWAVANNITSGTSAATFSPNNDCLRAQVVTFLWRAAGEPEPTSARNPFVDVKPSDFYYKAVLWAVENNITNGADATHFNPMGICNRAQVVTFLYRAFRSPAVESTGNPFTDVPEGSFYRLPVLWAVENGITNGLSATQFGPNANCNRAQIVTFLHRAYT